MSTVKSHPTAEQTACSSTISQLPINLAALHSGRPRALVFTMLVRISQDRAMQAISWTLRSSITFTITFISISEEKSSSGESVAGVFLGWPFFTPTFAGALVSRMVLFSRFLATQSYPVLICCKVTPPSPLCILRKCIPDRIGQAHRASVAMHWILWWIHVEKLRNPVRLRSSHYANGSVYHTLSSQTRRARFQR
jgi:hypothetical protein